MITGKGASTQIRFVHNQLRQLKPGKAFKGSCDPKWLRWKCKCVCPQNTEFISIATLEMQWSGRPELQRAGNGLEGPLCIDLLQFKPSSSHQQLKAGCSPVACRSSQESWWGREHGDVLQKPQKIQTQWDWGTNYSRNHFPARGAGFEACPPTPGALPAQILPLQGARHS